ncbi:MAG: hypothetical protein ABI548_06740 [Polyangiaceae bacterium]
MAASPWQLGFALPLPAPAWTAFPPPPLTLPASPPSPPTLLPPWLVFDPALPEVPALLLAPPAPWPAADAAPVPAPVPVPVPVALELLLPQPAITTSKKTPYTDLRMPSRYHSGDASGMSRRPFSGISRHSTPAQ